MKITADPATWPSPAAGCAAAFPSRRATRPRLRGRAEGARAAGLFAPTGIEAAALRLRDGEDFLIAPAASRKLLRENFCARKDGKPCASAGRLCRLHLRRTEGRAPRTDAPRPAAATAPAYQAAAVLPEGDARWLRLRCNSEGYESVALIPLRADQGIIGLLQLNDRRPDLYPPETLRFFEDFAAALARNICREQAAGKAAQAAKAEAVRRLAGGMAHDFNNILGAVRGYAEFLRADLPPDSPGRGDAEEILTAADRAAAFAASCWPERGQPPSPEPRDLNQAAGGWQGCSRIRADRVVGAGPLHGKGAAGS